ncbi:MAG: dephospho-CoA kinase [Acutalibacteraceae bacterium]
MRTFKIVGLTGSTGSGKSTVANMLIQKGCAVVDADALSREITEKDSPCLKALSAQFGCDILNADGTLNRQKLAEKAFVSQKTVELLNSLTHPFIYMLAIKRIKEYADKGFEIIIFDAPVLFESSGDVLCDITVAVISSTENRISRIMSRDNITKAQAMQRINVQKQDEYYISQSDIIIENNGDLRQTEEKVNEIFALINNKSEIGGV